MIITDMERRTIINNMMNLLDEYDYDYSYDALDDIVSEWERNKAPIIEAFKKHPNYLEGKFMIAFDYDYERATDEAVIRCFCDWLVDRIGYVRDFMPKAMRDIADKEYHVIPQAIFNALLKLHKYTNQFVTKETKDYLNSVFPEANVHEGQKMSRVVNKICGIIGYDKVYGYNREFAKYADALNPLVIKRHTILSINPLDYLTMSFGNSWASCHTIDKRNKRGMPNDYSGCYSSGTVSYMLDPSSMVFYTVDASYNGNDYWTQPKINRQMFHWGEEKLIQARLYPQDNDGYSDAYTPYRNIVQEIISTIYGFPNLWTLSKGTDNASRYIISGGTHYRDYTNFSNCNMSRVKGSENENNIYVGHSPICIQCGETHSIAENINCCNGGLKCEDCGYVISEDDAIYIDGSYYCRDCVSYCECCDEYHRDEGTWIESEDRYVCDGCLNEYYRYCHACGEYYYYDETRYIESEDRYVCDHCYEDEYDACAKCGEVFRIEYMIKHNGYLYCEDCHEEMEEDEEDEVDEAV